MGARFSAPVQTGPWGPPSLPYNRYRLSFLQVKRPRRGVYHPPPSSAWVKERVELYFYSPSGLLWSLLGQTLPFCPCVYTVYLVLNFADFPRYEGIYGR